MLIDLMKYLRVVVPCLVFLHSLLVAPLLVECVTSDGQTLIEILGQDPCHNNYLNTESAPENAPGMSAGKTAHAADPCTDFYLCDLDGTKDCLGSAFSPPQAPLHLDRPDDCAGIATKVDSRNPRWALILPPGHNPPSHSILRT